jgi:Tol biopolymer transport system component
VLIIADTARIYERDITSGQATDLLVAAAPSTFLLDPAVSPDEQSIAYIEQPPPKVEGGRFDAGSDLWVMDRDGGNPRLVWQHREPNQLVRYPRWEGNDNILAIVQEISTADGLTRVVYTLERINVETGTVEKLIGDVLSFDISPDGRQVVYAKLLPQTGETLEGAQVDGTAAYEVVGADQFLAPFAYPRFSPDGGTIAFASADQTGARRRVDFVALDASRSVAADEPRRLLDGLPQDIWTVEASGGQARRVADLKEDLPALTWDGSGERLYVLGANGLYEVDLASGTAERLGEGAFHASLTWAADR